jgi:hypothetical protein
MGRGKKRTRRDASAAAGASLRSLPTVALDCVYHIGTLNPADKRRFSYEGAGLSFSLAPAEWERIAELPAAAWWRLVRRNARFLDYHALDQAARRTISAWAIEQGLAEIRRGVRIEYDHEFEFSGVERCVCFCATRAEAEETVEAEEMENAVVSPAEWLAPLPKLEARTGAAIDVETGCFDYLLPIWVEECTDLDGVWWEDVYDPAGLSAPRGVIVPSRLQRFARTELDAATRAELGSPY